MIILLLIFSSILVYHCVLYFLFLISEHETLLHLKKKILKSVRIQYLSFLISRTVLIEKWMNVHVMRCTVNFQNQSRSPTQIVKNSLNHIVLSDLFSHFFISTSRLKKTSHSSYFTSTSPS